MDLLNPNGSGTQSAKFCRAVQREIETLDSDNKEDMEDLKDNLNSLLKNSLVLDQCGGNVEETEFDNYFLAPM